MKDLEAALPTTSRPVGLYVHLPFCTTKCGYCDFYSLPTIPDLIGDFIEAIEKELAIRDPGRPVESIFIGGGTPTVLPKDALARLLKAVSERGGRVAEFTVEANPSSADELKLELLRKHGVNRVSFGAQSFHADELAVLERLHAPEHIAASIAAARAAGFDNVNLDLIYGIPGQTSGRWSETLKRAVDVNPEHLSCYGLMYEPGTSLTRLRDLGRIVPCDEEIEAEMFETTVDVLAAAGFEHYEISNFARPGRRCRANLIYWENREYLGVGPSAVSYLDGVRQKNVPDVRKYVHLMQAEPAAVVSEKEELGSHERACETAVQMLRMTEGINRALFHQLTGYDAAALFTRQIGDFSSAGLLETTPTNIRLTRRGLLLADRVMTEFLPEP